ncbi:ABC transporter ATP-binding protein, partial [Coprococcus sp. MSK.21.13]|nr:ABC transporter ATP-binding protein [Coprococcus sp. MSK.21.13]
MITLSTKDLSVGYENKIIVDNVNIKLIKGETLCLLGPNGAGKTTILRTISKLLDPIKGMVYIEGQNIKDISNKEISKKMSVVLTNKFNGGLMTVFNVVAMGRYPYTGFFGYLGKNDIEKIYEALKIVNAEDIKEAYFDELSDGQKQKVLVARALVQEPEVIVLDEPTTHLDIKHRLELIEILRKLTKEKGITVILSLHEIDMALKSCDKVILVNKGKIIAYGTPEDVVDENTIEKLYGIKEANFNNLLGSIELSNNNKPKAFVIGGSGYGSSI